MGRAGIEQLLFLLDEAFEGDREHSLLGNLRSLRADDWTWLPEGARRSIRDIVAHVCECKYVYDDHAFGAGVMRWDRPGSIPSIGEGDSPEQIVEWLRAGQRRLRDSVAALADDDELLKPRRANWGEMKETRWIIAVMIEHDLYHGGEINRTRSLHHRRDAWAYEQAQ